MSSYYGYQCCYYCGLSIHLWSSNMKLVQHTTSEQDKVSVC